VLYHKPQPLVPPRQQCLRRLACHMYESVRGALFRG
jgi:hypothetical protein